MFTIRNVFVFVKPFLSEADKKISLHTKKGGKPSWRTGGSISYLLVAAWASALAATSAACPSLRFGSGFA